MSSVLAAAEAASPVDAVEAVTRELGLALGATKVSFLIADLSGRALVRLAHVQLRTADGVDVSTPVAPGERRAVRGVRDGPAVRRRPGGAARCAPRRCRSSRPSQARPESDGAGSWLVLAPVTERGEVIGLLELTLPRAHRTPPRAMRSRSWRTCWRSW